MEVGWLNICQIFPHLSLAFKIEGIVHLKPDRRYTFHKYWAKQWFIIAVSVILTIKRFTRNNSAFFNEIRSNDFVSLETPHAEMFFGIIQTKWVITISMILTPSWWSGRPKMAHRVSEDFRVSSLHMWDIWVNAISSKWLLQLYMEPSLYVSLEIPHALHFWNHQSKIRRHKNFNHKNSLQVYVDRRVSITYSWNICLIYGDKYHIILLSMLIYYEFV